MSIRQAGRHLIRRYLAHQFDALLEAQTGDAGGKLPAIFGIQRLAQQAQNIARRKVREHIQQIDLVLARADGAGKDEDDLVCR
ncbi:MAG: hypothetical protein BWY77_01798 [bacterium ADurb.Bin431]|nr:MAG: hypothetical protein BWY77_01798 [bacterium ADurb.Bin431]